MIEPPPDCGCPACLRWDAAPEAVRRHTRYHSAFWEDPARWGPAILRAIMAGPAPAMPGVEVEPPDWPLDWPPGDPAKVARLRSVQGLQAAPRAVLARPDVPTLSEWQYVDEDRLLADTRALFARLPPTIDAVCAIARSGLLTGTPLATWLHVPLWVVPRHDGPPVWPGHGERMEGTVVDRPRHVLLIDDTAAQGRAMRAVAPRVRAAWPGAEVTRAVVYCHPNGLADVDLCAAVYPGSHYLAWNWPNAGHGEACGYDFDGILCPDFTVEQCADMATYRAAMAAMPPRFLPRRSVVPLIATGRPESCRDLTEAWLARWGVRVERLAMWPGGLHPGGPDVAAWKAERIHESRCTMFAESDPGQAETIHRLTGRAVLCPALGRVLPPVPPPAPRRPEPDPADVARAQANVAAIRAARTCPERYDAEAGCACWAKCRRLGGRRLEIGECARERLAGSCPD